MDYTRAETMTRALTRDGGALDCGPQRARLLVQVLRTLAQGSPVTVSAVDRITDAVGLARADGHAFRSAGSLPLARNPTLAVSRAIRDRP